MAGGQTFNKRQKERARQEAAAAKLQKKAERKLEKAAITRPEESKGAPAVEYDEEGQPKPLDFHDF
jgi:hypothetical protein